MSPSRALERGRLRGQRTGIPWPLGGTSGSGAVPLPGVSSEPMTSRGAKAMLPWEALALSRSL
jgi:hypothetical protein